MARILIVEDEQDILSVLEYNLRQSGHEVTTTRSGRDGLRLVKELHPDLILLDLMLPDLSGTDVCKQLKEAPATRGVPVVMLTARGEEIDRVVGFELGADDYVVKPFSGAEVIARIRAVLRRATAAAQAEDAPEAPISIDDLHVDLAARRATLKDEELALSRKEFDLLAELVRNAGRVVTREALMDRVWDENWFGSTKTLDVHVRWLRGKLGETAENAHYLETVRGVGFRFRGPE